MQKHRSIVFLVIFVFLMAGTRGEAFVPQTPHLLHLVVNKIRRPQGMTVSQTRKITSPTNVAEQTEPAPDIYLPETLTYFFPEHLRSDIRSGQVNRFYLLSDKGFVKVKEGRITALEKSLGEYYTDPLLYRDYEVFTRVLTESGIDTEKVTFQRLEGKICYLIGQPAYGSDEMPGLWIEKDSFFPVRYLVKKGNRTVDIRYGNWQRVSRTWYPVETRILVDGILFAEIGVNQFELTSGASNQLFDIDAVLQQYPRALEKGPENTAHDGAIENLDKDVDEFSKLYD
ncbi:MAG: hypothetical protein MI892_28660 [Desulfobacterales bacterium]|nr:hypothetical protein [Desulfobacterales bacterium]